MSMLTKNTMLPGRMPPGDRLPVRILLSCGLIPPIWRKSLVFRNLKLQVNPVAMKLSENWFVEGQIDFELQKYRLLAYLQDIESSFAARRLYPPLTDLRQHYSALQGFIAHKRSLEDRFPKRITALDLARGRVQWERLQHDDPGMDDVQEITDYAAGRMRRTLESGKELYESVARRMAVEPVGINPASRRQGYLLLCLGSIREMRAYRYYLSGLQLVDDDADVLQLCYLDSWPLNLVNTPNAIKTELVRKGSALYNPAAFALATDLKMPVEETLLPIATEVFSRYLASA